MTVFWLVAACLVVAALLFVMPPLLRREAVAVGVEHDKLNVDVYRAQLAELEQDLANGTITQEQHDRSRTEIERRLLDEVTPGGGALVAGHGDARVSAIVVAIGVPLCAIVLYQVLGAPQAIDPKAATVAAPQQAEANVEHPDTGKQVEALIEELAARLEADPSNMEGWLMLARSYRFLRRHAEAIDAFERAMPLVEGNAQLLADYADTLAMATNGVLDGKPIQMIERALQLEPTNIQALWLKGTYQFEKGDLGGALISWRRLQQLVPPGSEEANSMANNIAEIEARMRQAGTPVPEPEAAPVVAASSAVTGRISLDPRLKDQVAPTDTVFIFARAASGPKMPLAILRKQASELPVEFRLDETMAMMPAMSLANYHDVVVGARVSKTGNATAQSGDLEGMSAVVRVGASNLDITINQVVQ